MKIAIRRIGNSKGIIIPSAYLVQLGLEGEVDVSIENDVLIVRASKKNVRSGWAQASKELAAAGDDRLAWPEFSNANDEELTW